MGVETKGRTFTSRAERGRRRGRRRGQGTKYQRTILQSKQDGGCCHGLSSRLNATSYFESSSNASLTLPPVSPLAVSLPTRPHCSRQDAPDVIATPPPPFLLPRFLSSPRTDREKSNSARQRATWRPSCSFEFCERTAGLLDAVFFNLEETREGGSYWNTKESTNKRERNRKSIKFIYI